VANAVPIVDYLVLGDDPHLVAKECTSCGARFVAGVFDCDGTSVRGNVINTEPDPEHVKLGMKVKLATYVVGTDDDGTEAIGFGFEPLEA
jgi:uncharacterized OB-fold protein